MEWSEARPVVGIVCTLLCLLLVAGMLTTFGPCAHEGAGCAMVGRAMLASAVVCLILSLVRVFELDEGERRGLDLGIALTAVLVALMPGCVMDLCADAAMACQAQMAPFARVVGTTLSIVAAADLVRRLLKIVRG